jgi:soluble lytic murein transglycosylase-like protein
MQNSKPMKAQLRAVIRSLASEKNVSQELALAIAQVESSNDAWAVRYEPGYRWFYFDREHADRINISVVTERVFQATSWGAMQVMGAVCREYGYRGPLQLLSVEWELALMYSVEHLKRLQVRFGSDWATLAAAYNAGSPRKTPGGLWENQRYVDKISQALREVAASPEA